jgi:hypothetical protein
VQLNEAPLLFLGELGQKIVQRPLSGNLCGGLVLKSVTAKLDSHRFACAAYFPTPSIRMFASPGCYQVVIGIGHCGSRLVGGFAMILSLQANDLRS